MLHGFGLKQLKEIINCLKTTKANKINMKIIRNNKSFVNYVKCNFESSLREGYKLEKGTFFI